MPPTVYLDKHTRQRSKLLEQSLSLGKSVFNLYEFTIIINISTDQALFPIGDFLVFFLFPNLLLAAKIKVSGPSRSAHLYD